VPTYAYEPVMSLVPYYVRIAGVGYNVYILIIGPVFLKFSVVSSLVTQVWKKRRNKVT
jgi:hypothetical protein